VDTNNNTQTSYCGVRLYRILVHCVNPTKHAGTVGSNLATGRPTCVFFLPWVLSARDLLQNNFCMFNSHVKSGRAIGLIVSPLKRIHFFEWQVNRVYFTVITDWIIYRVSLKVFPWLQTFITRKLPGIQTCIFFSKCNSTKEVFFTTHQYTSTYAPFVARRTYNR